MHDLAGQTFGRLIVLSRAAAGKSSWLCRCSCGTEKIILTSSMTSGRVNSCGCLQKEKMRARATKHGLSATKDYKNWHKMLERCNNPRCNTYHRYGARGIRVCERWHKFEDFFADMGPRPSPAHSLDRYPDHKGNYEPGNCRWATRVEQNNNTSRNRMVEFRGEAMSISDAIRKSGTLLGYGTIMQRINLGWDLEMALTVKSQRKAA